MYQKPRVHRPLKQLKENKRKERKERKMQKMEMPLRAAKPKLKEEGHKGNLASKFLLRKLNQPKQPPDA